MAIERVRGGSRLLLESKNVIIFVYKLLSQYKYVGIAYILYSIPWVNVSAYSLPKEEEAIWL